MKKRILAILLVVCLCAALLPVVASADSETYGPVSFELGGETYYMGLANWSSSEVPVNDGVAIVQTRDESTGMGNFVMNACVGFWKSDKETVVNATELKSIKNAFGDSLSITYKTTVNNVAATPNVTPGISTTGWPCASTYSFARWECMGDWVFTVSGTVGGEIVTSYSLLEMRNSRFVDFDWSILEEDDDIVTAINEWYEKLPADSSDANIDDLPTYRVVFPAGTKLTGIITIPDSIKKAALEAPYGAEITGGVDADNFLCSLINIKFIGGGKSNETWQSGPNAGKANVGFSGTSFGQCDGCVFQDFYVGLKQEYGFRNGGDGNQYIGNGIGMLIERTETGDGNNNLGRGLFKENDVAVQFEKSVTRINMCTFTATQFVDNEVDINNNAGNQKYFLPGNYFEHKDNNNEPDPLVGLKTNKYVKGSVYLTPGAVDKEIVWQGPEPIFTQFYFPSGDGNAVMSTANTGKYKIKSSDLSGTFTVIDNANSEDEAAVTLDFGEAQPVAQTYSLRRMRAVENEFDATVTVTKAENSITVSIKEIPDGKTPTVTLECGDWCGAEVSCEDGEVSDVGFASKKVSFTALAGGPHTYTITTAKEKHSWNWGEVTKTPTYAETGKILYSCRFCDATKEETLPRLVYTAPVTPVEPEVEPPFTDIPAGSYYADAVKWAYNNDVTTGATETTFAPAADCQRAQVITFLWRAAGCPEPSGTGAGLSDIATGTYYEKAVKWAIEKGITNGLTATSFGVNTDVTRAQFVTFLWRYAGCPKPNGAKEFKDISSGAYYSDAVLWAAENGITDGIGGGKFAPNDVCTRAQIVTFLYRYFG